MSELRRKLSVSKGFRMGLILMFGAWLPIVVYPFAPTPEFIYALMVVAHVLNFGGYLLTAFCEWIEHRRFSVVRLFDCLGVGFVFAIRGPVLISALYAYQRSTTR